MHDQEAALRETTDKEVWYGKGEENRQGHGKKQEDSRLQGGTWDLQGGVREKGVLRQGGEVTSIKPG